MRHLTLRSSLLRLAAAPLALSGLLAASLPATAASGEYPNISIGDTQRDYQTCSASLSNAGLTPADIAAACSAALYPKTLSECVVKISRDTTISAENALDGCRRVRRPSDMATCVVDISRSSSTQTALTDVLDNCRRSLLPTRFSNCVVGIQKGITLSTTEAMTSCISSTDRPRNFLPNFIPAGSVIPLPASGITTPSPTTGGITTPSPNLAPLPNSSP